MNESVRPEEAAQALSEIGQRHEQVVEVVMIPTWFWWAVALLMVGFTTAVDTRRPLVVGIATAVFVTGVLIVVGRVIINGLRRAMVRNDLIGPRGVLAILGFVALVLAVSLPISFTLDAMKVGHGAVVGVGVGAVVMVVGGPWLRVHPRSQANARVVCGDQAEVRRIHHRRPAVDRCAARRRRLGRLHVHPRQRKPDSALSKQLTALTRPIRRDP